MLSRSSVKPTGKPSETGVIVFHYLTGTSDDQLKGASISRVQKNAVRQQIVKIDIQMVQMISLDSGKK